MGQKKALTIALNVGTYAWCRCNASKNMPWCDGNHKKENKVAPLVFYQPEKRDVVICTCSETQKPPFCDNSMDCMPHDP